MGLGEINPFRYRGYFYDTDMGLYYLKTRYYDPEVGRFINMDGISYSDPETLNGLNLYSYCGNNPVMNVDPEGHAWWHWLVAAAVVVGLAVATVVTAGGVGLGVAAISAAAVGTTAVGATAVTTSLAFATLGAGMALAASGICAGITAIEDGVKNSSVVSGIQSFLDYGEIALSTTISAGITGGVGGYFTYKERIGNPSQSGFMTKSQRAAQRRKIWKDKGNKDGKADAGKEINHIYGTYGNNRNYYIIQDRADHKAFHKIYGYKTAGGSFNRLNPNFHNWWYLILDLIGT